MSKPLKVLILEDSITAYELLLRELRLEGYEPTSMRVETAADMEAAPPMKPGTSSYRIFPCRSSTHLMA